MAGDSVRPEAQYLNRVEDAARAAARRPQKVGYAPDRSLNATSQASESTPYMHADRSASVLGRGAITTRQAMLLRMQQTAGNRWAQRYIQRMAAQPDDGTISGETPPNLAARLGMAAGSGSSLEPAVRLQLEQRLGAGLSDVRIHTDAEADQMARTVEAVAFASGQNVFFRSGAYDPGSPEGMQLLTHEVTHTLQQAHLSVTDSSMGRPITVSDPAEASEREARGVAKEASSLPPTSAIVVSTTVPTIQRFASDEHRDLGVAASGGATLDIDLGDGDKLTYGEMVALAGDYFGSLDELRRLADSPAGEHASSGPAGGPYQRTLRRSHRWIRR